MSCIQTKNNKIKQLFVVEQPVDTCGFVEPSVLADNNPDFIKIIDGANVDYTVEKIETEELKASLSKSPDVAGKKFITLSASFLLRGFDGGTPFYNAPFIGAGLIDTPASEHFVISSVSDTIYAGETITGAGGTALVVETVKPGDTIMQIKDITGTLAAETVTATGGKTCDLTTGTEVAYGVGYQFKSVSIQNLSFRFEEDGMQTKGFDGSCTISFETTTGGKVQCNIELTAKVLVDTSTWFKRTAANTAINEPDYNQPVVLDDANIQIDGYLGIVQGAFNIDLAAEVSELEDSNTAGSIAAYDIGDRAPIASFIPLTQSREVYDYVQSYETFQTVVLSGRFGKTQGNKILFYMPEFQRESIPSGQNNNKMNRTVNGMLKSTVDDEELFIYVV